MGVSLSYWTTHVVAPDVKARVEAEAQQLVPRRRWWGDPIWFFNWDGKQGHLAGDSKVFVSKRENLDGEEIEVELDENEFMSMYDSRFIIEQLQRWSAQHALTWEVLFAGQTAGTIAQGQPSTELASWLAQVAVTVGATGDERDERRAQQIWSRYAS